MMKVALVGLAVMGLAAPAMGVILPPPDASDRLETRQVAETPEASEATLADCQVWTDQLGELLEEADQSVPEDVKEEAESSHEAAAEACDEGRYDEGIAEAKEAIEKIEAEGEDPENETET